MASRSPAPEKQRQQRSGGVLSAVFSGSTLAVLFASIAVAFGLDKKGWLGLLEAGWARIAGQAFGVAGVVAAWTFFTAVSTKRVARDADAPSNGPSRGGLPPADPTMSEAEAAAEFARTAEAVWGGDVRLGNPPQEDLLRLYSLFKQATQGDCKVPRPSMLDMAGAVKWDAWNCILGMPIQTARASYVALVQQLSGPARDSPPEDENAEAAEAAANMGFGGFGGGGLKGGLEAGGDWYDDEPTGGSGAGASASAGGSESGGVALWALARDGKVLEIDEALKGGGGGGRGGAVDVADESGRAALYWAADRGHASVISCLLKHGADLNAQGEDGQTALHCAIVCEYEDVVGLLLDAGANTLIGDEYGETAVALAKEMLGEESAISQRVALASSSQGE